MALGMGWACLQDIGISGLHRFYSAPSIERFMKGWVPILPASVLEPGGKQHGQNVRKPTRNRLMSLSRLFLQQTALGALVAAAALFPSQRTFAADKITLMVGGYEKQIYLPAKLTEALGYFKD